jgi:alkanesulfonate monooxygenase SsuD/methylene tetrahydromethanopterin reductase-like flavin-dependent oxidoreductase (luciferase family)
VPKQIHVNLFEMNCVGHISHGLWVHPDNNRHRFNDMEFWTELAKLLEYGGFDAVFLADVIGAYDGFRAGPETALREAVQIPNNDPLLLIPAMAAVTRNLGFAATFSTTYEPPFAFARRMSTLDHLTKGRVAGNVVTSYLPNAARNFGLVDEIEHDHRYEMADEYLEVLYKLWEGSWAEDAVVRDRKNRIYTDPAKVRYINHAGRYHTVAGPHLSSPPGNVPGHLPGRLLGRGAGVRRQARGGGIRRRLRPRRRTRQHRGHQGARPGPGSHQVHGRGCRHRRAYARGGRGEVRAVPAPAQCRGAPGTLRRRAGLDQVPTG